MLSLVTGGAGFIGSQVASHCLRMGHRVVILDDLSGGTKRNIPEGAQLVQDSVMDERVVQDIFNRFEIDYVYHLAAYAAEGLSHFIRRFNYSNNVLGSINLINEAVKHQVKCFVFTSSIAVYGTGQLPMLEEQTPQPEDPYGISKYAVELDLRAAHRMFGLKFVIFRPHNVFGEHQNLGDRYRNVVGIFMRQALCGRPMTIFGDGSQTRAFSYIEDVAPYIARSVIVPEAQNQVFNVGADHPVSVLRMAHLVAGALGVEPRLEFLPRRNEVAHAFSSQEKIRSVFGAQPSVSVEEGVSRMAQWAKSLGSLAEPPPFGAIEIPMQLPPSWVEADKSQCFR